MARAHQGHGLSRLRRRGGPRLPRRLPRRPPPPRDPPRHALSLHDAANQADWILIAPEALLPAAEPLVLHRQAQGLSAQAVSLESVYDDFGFGEASPDAVREFLAYAYHHWTAPAPRYVLLLGDASYDPKGFFSGTSRKDLLPSPLTKSSFLWTASDPLYASTNGDDLLPDLALGRLTAGSLAEAQAAVEKILAFENAGRTLSGKAVLVADNPDLAGDFEANANDIASLLTSGPSRRSSSPSTDPPPRPPSSAPSTPVPPSSPTSATDPRPSGPTSPRTSSAPQTSISSSPSPSSPSSSP